MKTGIVLSGGGTKAFAHLGVLQALMEAGIRADMLSGSSAGSIIGAFIADGRTPEETFALLKRYRLMDYISPTWPARGLMDLDNLEKNLKKHLNARTFAQLKTPLYVSASNLYTGKVEYLGEGPLVPAVIASSSVPFLFEPIRLNGQLYVDGGLLDNLPYAPLTPHCGFIITINITRTGEVKQLNSLKDIALRTMDMVVDQESENARSHSDWYIEPPGTENVFLLDTRYAEEFYKKGYDYTKMFLEKLGKEPDTN